MRRWNRDHSAELQSAYLNGCGVLLWDNVFGSWVGWHEADRVTHRRMRAVQLAFSDLLVDGDWTPLADVGPAAEENHVYASRFADRRRSLYLLVNRQDREVTVTLSVDGVDLFGGPEHRPGIVTLSPKGIGAVLVGDLDGWSPPPESAGMSDSESAGVPVAEMKPLQRMVIRRSTDAKPSTGAGVDLTPGPHSGELRFRRRENGMLSGAWWTEAWKPLAPDLHAQMAQDYRTVVSAGVRVRVDPVTNAEFAEFLRQTGHRPLVRHRFVTRAQLEADPPGPVTFVDLSDALAYAEWAGARLPTAAEWHLAVQAGKKAPPQMIWQWTADFYLDGATRFDLLVGGRPAESDSSAWYFDSGPHPAGWVAKLTMPGRGLARSVSLGFGLAWGPESATSYGAERITAPGPSAEY